MATRNSTGSSLIKYTKQAAILYLLLWTDIKKRKICNLYLIDPTNENATYGIIAMFFLKVASPISLMFTPSILIIDSSVGSAILNKT